MSDEIINPPTTPRCPKCGFASAQGDACEACGALFSAVRPASTGAARGIRPVPVKKASTGGWLAPALLVASLLVCAMAGLWFYFRPQIEGSLNKAGVAIADAMKNPDAVKIEASEGHAQKNAATAKASTEAVKPREAAKAQPGGGARVAKAPAESSTRAPAASPAAASGSEPKVSAEGAQALMSMFSGMLGERAAKSPPEEAAQKKTVSWNSTVAAPAAEEAPTPAPVASLTPAAGRAVRQVASAAPRLRQAVPSSKSSNRPILLSEESFSSGRTPAPGGQRVASAGKGGALAGDLTEAVIVKPPASGVPAAAPAAAGGPAKVVELTGATFDTFVNGGGPVVVDFWAPWCGPCVRMAPVIENVAGSYGGAVRFGKIDVDEYKALASRYKIESLPTLVMFKGGTARGRSVGGLDAAELKKWVDSSR